MDANEEARAVQNDDDVLVLEENNNAPPDEEPMQQQEQDEGPRRNEDGSLDGGVAVLPNAEGELKAPDDCDLVRGTVST